MWCIFEVRLWVGHPTRCPEIDIISYSQITDNLVAEIAHMININIFIPTHVQSVMFNGQRPTIHQALVCEANWLGLGDWPWGCPLGGKSIAMENRTDCPFSMCSWPPLPLLDSCGRCSPVISLPSHILLHALFAHCSWPTFFKCNQDPAAVLPHGYPALDTGTFVSLHLLSSVNSLILSFPRSSFSPLNRSSSFPPLSFAVNCCAQWNFYAQKAKPLRFTVRHFHVHGAVSGAHITFLSLPHVSKEWVGLEDWPCQ